MGASDVERGRGIYSFSNRFAWRLMRLNNTNGIFSNVDDDERGLERGLASSFKHVEIEVVGAVALFAARDWGYAVRHEPR